MDDQEVKELMDKAFNPNHWKEYRRAYAEVFKIWLNDCNCDAFSTYNKLKKHLSQQNEEKNTTKG